MGEVPLYINKSIPRMRVGRNVKRFPGGLVCKAHRLVCHSALGSREIKKKKVGRTFLSWSPSGRL